MLTWVIGPGRCAVRRLPFQASYAAHQISMPMYAIDACHPLQPIPLIPHSSRVSGFRTGPSVPIVTRLRVDNQLTRPDGFISAYG